MSTSSKTRREFLRRSALAAASAAVVQGRGVARLLSAAKNAPGTSKPLRPNILWISTEDIGPHLGCYGWKHAHTPTLDKLAAEGVLYTHAYSHSGVCAPTRSGIITGMYPTTLGSQHMRCRAALPAHVRCFPEYLREAGYHTTNNSKQDYNFSAGGAWDESSGRAHWRKRPKGKPFFSVRNFTNTHEGGIAGRRATPGLRQDQRQDPEKLPLPPYYPDTPVARADWAKYHELITQLDYHVADLLKQLADDGLADDTIVFFWADHGVGLPRAKRWLYESGTHVPLIVRIPEKFRTGGQGRPGTVDDRLVAFVDLAPTVLNLAGVKVPEHMQGRTFLGPGCPPQRRYVYGARDRMDERYDIIRSVRDKRHRYIRNYEPFKAYYQYMNTPEKGQTMRELRRLHKAAKLPPPAELFMAETKPLEELYDLEKDPHEINNLASSPAHKDVLERLRAAQAKWMAATRDTGLLPEPDMRERASKLSSEYAILRQPGGEKLMDRLLEVAALAGRPGRADLTKLLAAMKDADAAVRYWGAIGLGNLGAEAKAAADRLAEALVDGSASVRIAAGRALCATGGEDKALPVLIEELKSPHEWVRLSAAIVLDGIGEKARPAVGALKAALKDRKNKYVVRVANHALNVLLGTSDRVR